MIITDEELSELRRFASRDVQLSTLGYLLCHPVDSTTVAFEPASQTLRRVLVAVWESFKSVFEFNQLFLAQVRAVTTE